MTSDVNHEVHLTPGALAVLWITPNGGNVRCKNKRNVQWMNLTGYELELRFREWLADGDLNADPVWPFKESSPQDRARRISVNGTWTGTLTGTGQNIVKYSVTAFDDKAEKIAELDPIIIVER